jgi:hypothetical protein
MERSDIILKGVADTVKAETGGDRFAFITFIAEPANSFTMRWNDFAAPTGSPYFVFQ